MPTARKARSASKADLLVMGGAVVLASGVREGASIVVRGGRVDQILAPGKPVPGAKQVIDARGKVVLPGVVDAHVHVETPGPPTKPFGVYADSFESMTRAAVAGGVTTVIPHVFASATTQPAKYLRDFRKAAERDAWADFGFHFGIRSDEDVAAIPEVVEMGVRSFKTLMAYKQQGAMASDRLLADAMREIGRWRGLMMVHAEDGELIDALEQRAKAAGQRTPPVYACCRPSAAENIAIIRALALARGTGCVLYIVHLSTREGLITAKLARDCGQAVVIETCPHYLFLTHEELQPHRLGPFAKIGPPLREQSNGDALWGAVREGAIDLIGSDHAPRLRADKLRGLEDIFAAPFGSPGLETLLPVLYDEFRKRRLPLTALARLLSETPARTFGMYPRKGAIAVGSDADLVVFDPAVRWTVDPERLQTNAKYSLWAGREVQGRAAATIVRGKVVYANGRPSGGKGRGRFLAHGETIE
jgi:dihydropyrimidinase